MKQRLTPTEINAIASKVLENIKKIISEKSDNILTVNNKKEINELFKQYDLNNKAMKDLQKQKADTISKIAKILTGNKEGYIYWQGNNQETIRATLAQRSQKIKYEQIQREIILENIGDGVNIEDFIQKLTAKLIKKI